MFRVIGARRLPGDTLLVADGSQTIRVYDPNGLQVRAIGRARSGPGEFQEIAWIDFVPPDSVFVFDERLGRISVFSRTGTLLHSISLNPDPTGPLPFVHGRLRDGSYISSYRRFAQTQPGFTGILRPSGTLVTMNPEGLVLDSIATVPLDEVAILQGVIARPDFLRRTTIRVAPPGYYLATGDTFAIRVFDELGDSLAALVKNSSLH